MRFRLFISIFFYFLFSQILWDCCLQSIIPITISRVNQVDAARLDIEMSAMLKEQLVKVFSLMKVFSHCLYNIVISGHTTKLY